MFICLYVYMFILKELLLPHIKPLKINIDYYKNPILRFLSYYFNKGE